MKKGVVAGWSSGSADGVNRDIKKGGWVYEWVWGW